MNNRWAIAIALLICGFFLLDHFYLGWDAPRVVLYQLTQIIETLAIWR